MILHLIYGIYVVLIEREKLFDDVESLFNTYFG